MSHELRARILGYLDDHERTPSAGASVDDSTLAQALSTPVQDIDRQLAILEEQGLVQCPNLLNERSARITPRGIVVVEELREGAQQQKAKRPIGFRSRAQPN